MGNCFGRQNQHVPAGGRTHWERRAVVLPSKNRLSPTLMALAEYSRPVAKITPQRHEGRRGQDDGEASTSRGFTQEVARGGWMGDRRGWRHSYHGFVPMNVDVLSGGGDI